MPVLERELTLDDLMWSVGQLVEAEASQNYRTPAPAFRDFIRDAWHLLEPAHPFIGGYHVDAITEHLEAVSDGELQNLIINIPPRHGKSVLASVLWPVWEWISEPSLRWLFASYGQRLSTRDSLKRRRLIMSSWYQERWGDRYRLTGDQNEKNRFENERTGLMIATSVGGLGTGEGGDRIVVDDPTNVDEADSDTERATANEWWDGTISTRPDRPGEIARVIIMQRLHEQDLVGHILGLAEQGADTYDHLILPAEYEPRMQVCVAGLEHDERTEPGQLLSPERFNAEALAKLKIVLGDRAAGQLQQRPAPAGGAIWLVDQFWGEGRNRYDIAQQTADPTKIVARYLSFDTAMKDKETNDPTDLVVGDLMADYRLRIRHVSSERVQFPELLGHITTNALRWNYDGKLRQIIVEDKGSGTSALQTLRAGSDPLLASLMQDFMPVGSKPYRWRQAGQWCALGCVEMPNPDNEVPWLFDFLHQLATVPGAAHDDSADSLAQLVIFLEHILAEGYRARNGVAA